jgi:hypothetical protein
MDSARRGGWTSTNRTAICPSSTQPTFVFPNSGLSASKPIGERLRWLIMARCLRTSECGCASAANAKDEFSVARMKTMLTIKIGTFTYVPDDHLIATKPAGFEYSCSFMNWGWHVQLWSRINENNRDAKAASALFIISPFSRQQSVHMATYDSGAGDVQPDFRRQKSRPDCGLFGERNTAAEHIFKPQC